ncbi:hypothetical protein D3C78_1348350 [compost metagenome]
MRRWPLWLYGLVKLTWPPSSSRPSMLVLVRLTPRKVCGSMRVSPPAITGLVRNRSPAFSSVSNALSLTAAPAVENECGAAPSSSSFFW